MPLILILNISVSIMNNLPTRFSGTFVLNIPSISFPHPHYPRTPLIVPDWAPFSCTRRVYTMIIKYQVTFITSKFNIIFSWIWPFTRRHTCAPWLFIGWFHLCPMFNVLISSFQNGSIVITWFLVYLFNSTQLVFIQFQIVNC